MQISRIQNIIKNTFQYKNNQAKFNPINFKGQDTFERNTDDDTVVSKKYYRGKQEFTPEIFIQSGDRLFIKNKDSYIPYGANLGEYNAKGELIKNTTYNNGTKYIVTHYKNGQKVQQDGYEDVFSRSPQVNKRTHVIKFEANNPTGKKPLISFAISRNYGKKWTNSPSIVFRQNGKNDSLFIYFATPSDEKNGEIEINYKNKNSSNCFYSIIQDDKDYSLKISSDKESNETAYLALQELKETIQSDEFIDDFGSNQKFNSELNKAIEFLSSKINED